MKKLLLTTVLMVLTLSAVAENKYRQYTVGLPFNMPEVKALRTSNSGKRSLIVLSIAPIVMLRLLL